MLIIRATTVRFVLVTFHAQLKQVFLGIYIIEDVLMLHMVRTWLVDWCFCVGCVHCLATAEEQEDFSNLEEENRMLKKAMTCRVCMDVEVSTLFLPCGHFVCCAECATQQLRLQRCPVCGSDIRDTVRASVLPHTLWPAFI